MAGAKALILKNGGFSARLKSLLKKGDGPPFGCENHPSGAKAHAFYWAYAARLKSRPDADSRVIEFFSKL
jgi:hypothetical protein